MSLSRTVFEVNGDFSKKITNFPTPCVFNAPVEGVPLELGMGSSGQKLE